MKPALLFLLAAATSITTTVPLSPEMKVIADHISEDNLRGNLSFLASDVLEGRSTPSRGQDIAAEFIASQFRRARLEQVNGSYFQTAELGQFTADPEKVAFSVAKGGNVLAAAPSSVNLFAFRAVAVEQAPLVLVSKGEELSTDIAGKAAFLDHPVRLELRDQVSARKPLLIVQVVPSIRRVSVRIAMPEQVASRVPVINVDAATGKHLSEEYAAGATVTLHAPAPAEVIVHPRNVIGVLPGSDPARKSEYVLVTAHYDHLAMKTEGADRIYNGANDDASGTVSVIEIAQALSAMPVKPRRSIVFLAFFGEELGLLGSRYYGSHPLFSLSSTIAQINIEQVGRVNPKEGFDLNGLTFTGFDYTDLPSTFAIEGTGVKVYSTKDTDAFFGRSDNQALADMGIPASTVSAAYTYADYHQVSDEWEKIDFNNMAHVDRAIALGVLALANRAELPHWNRTNPKAERYWRAYEQLHSEAKH